MSLLFFAYGYLDPMLICRMIAHTASSFSPETIRRLLYDTFQHTTSVRTQAEALAILSGYMQQQQQGTAPPRVASGTTAAAAVARGGTTGPGVSPVEDLLSRGSLGPAGPPVSTRERPASSVQQCCQDGIPCSHDRGPPEQHVRSGHRPCVSSVRQGLSGQQTRGGLWHPHGPTAAERSLSPGSPLCVCVCVWKGPRCHRMRGFVDFVTMFLKHTHSDKS